MKITKTLPQIGIILFFIIALASCEEDFNTIGVDIIGDEINNLDSIVDKTVVAYSRKLEIIETNNLPSYKLGFYNDPIYGASTVDLVSQLLMNTTSPSFGDGDEAYPVVLDSVYLYLPFYSDNAGTVTEPDYSLDSIYGNQPINLSIYESKYYLRDFDPDSNFEDPQKYYSNLGEVFTNPNNVGEMLYSTTNFVPDNEGFILKREAEVDSLKFLPPGIRVALPIDFFQEKIIDMQGTPELLNNNNFKEYFRGIIIDVEAINGMGNLFIFDLEDAVVTTHYNFDRPREDALGNPILDEDDIDGDGDTTEQIIDNIVEEFDLSFAGINANMFTSEDLIDFNNPDVENGEERLYLRGGNGYMTVINLFGTEDLDNNGIPDELDELRQDEWLINEANLTFYVDQDQVTGGELEPERILIYDLNNNQVLVDFGFDLTQGEEPENALTEHLGKLQRGNDENGDYYKIKITNHINNLLNRDSTNISLGLVVSQNVVQGGFQDLEEPIDTLSSVPSTSVISPEGTVLHGNLSSNEDKKLKLRIYYTDPNN